MRFSRFVSVASLIAFACTGAYAATKPAPKAATKPAAPAAVSVVKKQFDAIPEQSEVSFVAIGKPSALKIVGKAAGPQGSAWVGGGMLSGEFRFDLKQLETGIAMRDSHMKEKYLEVDKYPVSVLKLQSVPYDGGAKTVNFTGTMSLHGVEKPVSGTATIEPSADGAKVVSEFELKTTDFNIAVPKFAGITVTESVKVSVNLQTKAAAK